MAKCTFSATPVVHIRIEGEPREFPVCPVDDGLIGDLLKWLNDQEIYPAYGIGGRAGGGIYSYSFYEEDANSIVAWLEARGVQKIG